MPVSIKAEALVFAIHAGRKLTESIQQAYALKLLGDELVLPPPHFDPQPNHGTAREFFENTDPETGGAQFLYQNTTLKEYHARILRGDSFGPHREWYLDFYKNYKTVLIHRQEDAEVHNRIARYEMLASMLIIKQWGADEATVHRKSALQLVAGTLIELGVDYFRQVPGVFQPDTPLGRAFMHFLTAFDRIPFSDRAGFQAHSRFILPQLFIAAADSLTELRTEITADPKLQRLLEVAGQGIAQDVYQLLEQLQPGQSAGEVVQWGQILLRSIIKNGAEHVVAHASELLDTHEAATALIQRTASEFLTAIFATSAQGIDLRNAFSVASLDRMIGAVLSVVAEYPEWLDSSRRFHDLIIDVATALRTTSVGRPGLLPELVRIMLERSAGHLTLLWGEGAGGQHLLVLATQHLLSVLAAPPAHGSWKPQLSDRQLIRLLELILDEVVQNPAWITEHINDKSALRVLLDEVFLALSHIPPANRLSATTLEQVLQTAIRVAATNETVLQTIKWGNGQQETTLLNKALDLIFAQLFAQGGSNISQSERLADLLEYTLQVLLRKYPDARGLMLLQLILFENDAIDYRGGFDKAWTDSLVESALNVLSTSPELVSNDEVFRVLVSDLVSILQSYGWKQPDVSRKVLRMLLASTAKNAELIFEADSDQPHFLLTIVVREVLESLSTLQAGNQWIPKLTEDQLLELIEMLIEQVVRNPHWLPDAQGQHNLVADLLQSVVSSITRIPAGERLHPDTYLEILEVSLILTATHPQLLRKVNVFDDGLEKAIIEQLLEIVFDEVFSHGKYRPAERATLLMELLIFVIDMLVEKYPNKKGLELTMLLIYESNIDWSDGVDSLEAQELIEAAIRILSEYPHLFHGHPLLLQMAKQVTAALLQGDDSREHLTARLMRMTFEVAEQELDRVLIRNPQGFEFLLATAIKEILITWNMPSQPGRWKPHLTDSQLLELIRSLLETVMRHPNWIKGDFILQKIINSVLRALEQVPQQRPVPATLIQYIIEDCIRLLELQPEWILGIIQLENGHKQIALSYALQEILLVIYDNGRSERDQWSLVQPEMLELLLHHFLMRLQGRQVSRQEVEALCQTLRQMIDHLAAQGKLFTDHLLQLLESPNG